MKTEGRMTANGLVPPRIDAIAEEAYRSGQPFMDNLVTVLRERGASTAEESAEHLRKGLLYESYTNPFLTPEERSDIWRRYDQHWLVVLAYRFEVWRMMRRIRRVAT